MVLRKVLDLEPQRKIYFGWHAAKVVVVGLPKFTLSARVEDTVRAMAELKTIKYSQMDLRT